MPFGKIPKKYITDQLKYEKAHGSKRAIVKKTNKIAKLIGNVIEKKQFDNYNNVTITQLGLLYNLTLATTQGSADGQRVGDSIFCKTMYLTYKIEYDPSKVVNQSLRVILFQDRMGYNSPTMTDVLEPIYINTAYAPLAQYNHAYMSRFKILHDRMYTLSPGGGQILHLKKRYKIDKKIEYIGTSTFKNQIWLLIIGDDTNVLSQPTVRWVSRMIYLDA